MVEDDDVARVPPGLLHPLFAFSQVHWQWQGTCNVLLLEHRHHRALATNFGDQQGIHAPLQPNVHSRISVCVCVRARATQAVCAKLLS